jgi:hypothetical protein
MTTTPTSSIAGMIAAVGLGAILIPVEDSFAAWRKDPEYVKTYNALDDEFACAAANAMRLRISFEPVLPTR